MKRLIKYVMVVCMVLAMVIPAGMTCSKAGAATAREAVGNYLDAYVAQDAAGMIECELETIGDLTADQRKLSYQGSFDLIDSITITERDVIKVTETDEMAIYRVKYNLAMKVSGVDTTQGKNYTINLRNDGGWLITKSVYNDIFISA